MYFKKTIQIQKKGNTKGRYKKEQEKKNDREERSGGGKGK